MKWNWQPATNKPVLLVMGPTGVGKTEWVLHFLTSFFHHQIEIINADSMQVYRGMDIGTAKPSADQRSRVPHHLMDCCLPNEPFTAGAFVEAADALLEPILNRRHLPVLCGGTGYYFKNFLMGLPAVPKTDLSLLLRLTADIQRSPGIGSGYLLNCSQWIPSAPPAFIRMTPIAWHGHWKSITPMPCRFPPTPCPRSPEAAYRPACWG